MIKKYIAIIRGINVGGKRKVLMADLRKQLREAGFSDVKTYIQSGNVIFSAPKKEEDLKLAAKIEDLILKNYDFEVPVIVRSQEELDKAISKNPFFKSKTADVDRLHLSFLNSVPKNENIEKANSFNATPDKFAIHGKDVFVYCSGRYSDSKLTNQFFEKKLQVTATTRNWKTVLKLSELAKE